MRSRSWTLRLAASLWLAFAAGTPSAAEDVQVPVPRAVIYPGMVISEGMLVDRPMPAAATAGLITDRAELIGKISRNTLLPSQPIGPNAVREEALVKQGKPVQVVFEAPGLRISTTAMTLQSGMAGDLITVRNTESGTTIKGTVQPDGTIRVGPP
jgi:flagella basal body P-ring formation protein FlgA